MFLEVKIDERLPESFAILFAILQDDVVSASFDDARG